MSLLITSNQSAAVEALKVLGQGGEVTFHATDCGDESFIYLIFDPEKLDYKLVDELVRDEAQAQRKRRL